MFARGNAASRWLFLAAYTASGLAGLIYELTWTRLLTLYMGHTTAAASTVAAAFMGGLAGGSYVAGRVAPGLTQRRTLHAYIGLELVVAVFALGLPWGLKAGLPVLAYAYQDGAGGVAFPVARLLLCLVAILLPALALGATFPMAVRWYARDSFHTGQGAGELYTANTLGAAVGAVAAGFALIPAIGISGTTLVGVGASIVAMLAVLRLARVCPDDPEGENANVDPAHTSRPRAVKRRSQAPRPDLPIEPPAALTMVAVVLGLSGFATLVYEIAWVRVLSLLVGPTTYAFAATLVTLIAGIGCGSLIGSRLAGRSRRPALWLSITMAATAMVTSWSTAVVGRNVPRLLAEPLSQLAPALAGLLSGHAVLVAALIVPTALGLGVGFPLALELLGSEAGVARRVGMVYAVNTLAALAGSLVAGFIAIPLLSLQPTLQLVSAMLLLGASVVIAGVKLPPRLRVVGVAVVALAVLPIVWNPQWDRDVLASGVYKYARRSTPGLDPMATLRAGKLLYYRDGAASTVSVKRLTGVISMSIDGKIDASSSGDMLTQKVLAHLPLLLHPDPRQVLVIGLGSGVTAASALVHPIARLDVVEISPEVVQASQYFKAQNRGALRDPRTHLILGDGRSHLLLSRRQYDVIVSEPSNPWMAGVAALFTREFFAAARERLAPGGVICQWAHTYDISEHDLRSIVATFRSVFPQGTMWLLGEGDVLLVASNSPLDVRLDGLTASWRRSGVAADLGEASVLEPFALLSQYVAGPRELERYADAVAPQTDDRMALEFSGPRALNSGADRHNASMLRALLQPGSAPMAVRRAMEAASGPQWRDRATMLLKIDDYEGAYRDYARALQSDSTDALALDGFVQAAGATGQQAEALARLKDMIGGKPGISTIRIAASRLLASSGAFQDAIAVLTPRGAIELDEGALLEQLASIYADLGESQKLDQTVARLRQFRPDTARTFYFAAAAEFLRQRFAQAATLAEKSVALDPQSSSAHNLVGVSRASEGRPEQARHAFLKALVLAPRDVTTYVNLGLLELSAGNRAAAAAYFAEGLSLDPKSTAAQQGFAEAQAGADR